MYNIIQVSYGTTKGLDGRQWDAVYVRITQLQYIIDSLRSQ